MESLAGELIALPSPNRPGFWAYRKLDDGAMLEIELTRAEWDALHEVTPTTNTRIENAIRHCDLPMVREEIRELHRILNLQAQIQGGDFYFKDEYVAAVKDFCIDPNTSNARALLNIAPQLIEYFESCSPGGNLYTANIRRK